MTFPRVSISLTVEVTTLHTLYGPYSQPTAVGTYWSTGDHFPLPSPAPLPARGFKLVQDVARCNASH